jgi:hypothetical protein
MCYEIRRAEACERFLFLLDEHLEIVLGRLPIKSTYHHRILAGCALCLSSGSGLL